MYNFLVLWLYLNRLFECYQWTWLLVVMLMPVANSLTIWSLWWGSSIAMFVNILLWSSNRLVFLLDEHYSRFWYQPLFPCSYVLLSDRQPSKCTNLLEKKGSYFGQFVASNYKYCHRFLSFFFSILVFLLLTSCDDFWQVLCDKSGEKLLLLAESLLKKHIASHSMHEPEGKFTFPPMPPLVQVVELFQISSPFLLLMKVWYQLSWCIYLCWNNNPNTMML